MEALKNTTGVIKKRIRNKSVNKKNKDTTRIKNANKIKLQKKYAKPIAKRKKKTKDTSQKQYVIEVINKRTKF